eukprot:8561174-Pyramimonas_sp.AAC.2
MASSPMTIALGASFDEIPDATSFNDESEIEFDAINPKTTGTQTHARYEEYKGATSIAEAKSSNATLADLRSAFTRGHMRVVNGSYIGTDGNKYVVHDRIVSSSGAAAAAAAAASASSVAGEMAVDSKNARARESPRTPAPELVEKVRRMQSMRGSASPLPLVPAMPGGPPSTPMDGTAAAAPAGVTA